MLFFKNTPIRMSSGEIHLTRYNMPMVELCLSFDDKLPAQFVTLYYMYGAWLPTESTILDSIVCDYHPNEVKQLTPGENVTVYRYGKKQTYIYRGRGCYPYHCTAKEKQPDDMIFYDLTLGCWNHETAMIRLAHNVFIDDWVTAKNYQKILAKDEKKKQQLRAKIDKVTSARQAQLI